MASKKRRQIDEEDEEEEEVEDDDADEDYEDKGDEADEEEDEEYEDEDSEEEEEEDGGKGGDGGDEDESEDEVEPAIQQSRREVRQQHAEEKLGSMTETDEEYSFYIVAELDEAQLFSACKTYSIIVCTNYNTNTTQYHAASRSTTQHYAALRSITQHHAASRSSTQHRAALRSITQHYAASRSIKQHIINAHNIITITSQLTLASRDLIHQRLFCRLTTQSFKAPTRILPPSCSLNKSNNLLYRIQPLTQLQMAPPQTIPIQIQMPTQIQMAPQQLQLQLQRTQIITTTSSTITTDLL